MINKYLRHPIRQMYAWVTHWAKTKHAETALWGVSFAESSFFPIPPDPLLMAMTFSKENKWLRFAFITTAASILGGIAGYLIGFGLFETIGEWIIDTYHLQDEYANLSQKYTDNAAIAVFSAALTPIPYKIITITAGAAKINLVTFVIASIAGRSMRFFAVAGLAKYLGKNHKENIEKYIDIISLSLIAILILLLLIISR